MPSITERFNALLEKPDTCVITDLHLKDDNGDTLFHKLTQEIANNPGHKPNIQLFQTLINLGGPHYLFIPNKDKITPFGILQTYDTTATFYPYLFFKNGEAHTTTDTTCIQQLYQQYEPELGFFEKSHANQHMFEKLNQLIIGDEESNQKIVQYLSSGQNIFLYSSIPGMYLQKIEAMLNKIIFKLHDGSNMTFQQVLIFIGEFKLLMQILMQRKYLADGKSFTDSTSCKIDDAVINHIMDESDKSEASIHRNPFSAWGYTETQKRFIHIAKQEQIQNALKQISNPSELTSLSSLVSTRENEPDRSTLMYFHTHAGIHFSDPDSATLINNALNASEDHEKIDALNKLAVYAGLTHKNRYFSSQ